MHGEEDELCAEAAGTDFRDSLKTGHDRHADVANNQVRLQDLDSLGECLSIQDSTRDFVVATEERSEFLKELGVIVSEENSFSFHG